MGRRKNRKGKTYPRSTYIFMTPTEDCKISELLIGPNKELILLDQNGKPLPAEFIRIEHGYENTNKKLKRIVSAEIDSDLVIDINAILRAYDYVFAIDTNTKKIPGNDASLSASVALELLKEIKHEDGRREYPLRETYSDLFVPLGSNMAERIGIYSLIGKIIRAKGLNLAPKEKVAIITDHDLGSHSDLNSRKMPLVPALNFYLPYNFTLIYARGDRHTRNDSIQSFAVSLCDQYAGAMLNHELGRPERVRYFLSAIASINK
jgi:hypothetical protein